MTFKQGSQEVPTKKHETADFYKFTFKRLTDVIKLHFQCFNNGEVDYFQEDKNQYCIFLQSRGIISESDLSIKIENLSIFANASEKELGIPLLFFAFFIFLLYIWIFHNTYYNT